MVTLFQIQKYFVFFGCITLTSLSLAKQVSEIKKIDGQPVQVVYKDHSVAEMLRNEKLDYFKVNLKVTENSCVPKLKEISCHLKIPYIHQYYLARWKNHTTQQGELLTLAINNKINLGSQYFITSDYSKRFENALKRINQSSLQENQFHFAELVCEHNVNLIFPPVNQILTLDETYEGANIELAMFDGIGARVNKVWRRYQKMNIEQVDKKVIIKNYQKKYGIESNDSPFGLAYTVQMLLDSKNYNNSEDKLCQIIWKVDFSRFFDQIQSLAFAEEKPQLSEYKIYNYQNEKAHYFAEKIFELKYWEAAGE